MNHAEVYSNSPQKIQNMLIFQDFFYLKTLTLMIKCHIQN